MKNAQPSTATPRLAYSIDEAAALLGVCRQTIYNNLHAGRLRAVKLGQRRLIPADALSELLTTTHK